MENKKTAIIIGAGPAGLCAAYNLLTETDIIPIILEESEYTKKRRIRVYRRYFPYYRI